MKPDMKDGDTSVSGISVYYTTSFKKICIITAAFPLLALIICLVTAIIFQPDEVHETHCRVYNIIPSISAITGVSPQRYLWRLSVAFHIAPRYIIAAAYKAYQFSLIGSHVNIQTRHNIWWWLNIAHWLNIIEVSALAGVTYISNIENYPIHEKLFITFMCSSLGHMVAALRALQRIAETSGNYHVFEKEIYLKKALLLTSLVCTVGMIGFFVEHRLLCHNLAFSAFAFCEYIVATANMAFHCTLVLTFPAEHLIIGSKSGVKKIEKVD